MLPRLSRRAAGNLLNRQGQRGVRVKGLETAAPGSHVRSSTLTGVPDPGAPLMGYCQVTQRLSFQGQKHRIIKQLQAHV